MIEVGATKGIKETIGGGSFLGKVALFLAKGEGACSKERRKS